jgi:GNAT superfamily N-acetyltransferase
MIEVAKNIETNYVKRGKGYQIIYTVSTEQEKAILSDYIRDLADLAKDYYDDDVAEFSKSTLKRAAEAGNKAWEELFGFEPTITNTVPEEELKKAPNDISTTDTPTNVVDDVNKLNQELNTKYAGLVWDNDYGLNFELRDGRLHITDMNLIDAERGKGIGSEIFDEIKQFADNNNLEISLYNDGDFNTTFWENKGFQEWSSKNNVDWANTPDDKLNLFILDADTPTGLSQGPGAAAIDDIAFQNTQLINNLPVEQVVKDRWNNLVKSRYRNLVTPGGLLDALDVWEFGVMGLMMLAIAYKEYDEIPKIFSRTATNMFNNMTAPYNIPPVPLEQYDLDYEFMNKVLETGEKVMPTDILIKKVQEVEVDTDYVSTYLPEGTTDMDKKFDPYQEGVAEVKELTANIKREKVKQDLLESKGIQEEKMFKKKRPKKSAGGGSGVKIL